MIPRRYVTVHRSSTSWAPRRRAVMCAEQYSCKLPATMQFVLVDVSDASASGAGTAADAAGGGVVLALSPSDGQSVGGTPFDSALGAGVSSGSVPRRHGPPPPPPPPTDQPPPPPYEHDASDSRGQLPEYPVHPARAPSESGSEASFIDSGSDDYQGTPSIVLVLLLSPRAAFCCGRDMGVPLTMRPYHLRL
jgi:hypothetical protein